MDRRVKKTRAAIHEAYISLLLEKDTPKITITELTRRANIDRKTFYLHYESVEDIVTEAIEDLLNRLLLILEQKDYFKHPLEFGLVFESINQLLEQDLPLYRHIAQNSVFRSFWDQSQNILAQTTIDMYRDITPIPLEELELSAKFYSAGIIAIYMDWLSNPGKLSIEQLGELASRLLGEGTPDLFGQ